MALQINSLRTIASALLSALAVFIGSRAAAAAGQPDFAFPTKVSAQSLTTLDRALAQGDGPTAIRSLIDYTLARDAVSSDNPSQAIAFIDSVGRVLAPKSAPAAALTELLSMRVYADVYNSSRWTYDRRTLPLTPLPDDCLEWSGSQFRSRLLTLGRSVLASSAGLAGVPLKTYAKVITSDRLTYVYYPTLWDFAASQIIQTLTPLVQSQNDSLYTLVSDTYAALIEADGQRTAPLIMASLGSINFAADYGHTSYSDRIKAVEALYDRYASSEYSGEVILALSHLIDNSIEGKRHLCDLINRHIKAFPAYYGNNALRNRLSELTQPRAQVSVPSSCAPGRPVEVNVSVSNAASVSVAVYEITSPTVIGDSWVNLKRLTAKKLLRRVTQTFDTRAPFDTTVTLTLPPLPRVGYYAVVPELPGVTADNNQSAPLLHCTRTALAWLSLPSSSTPLTAVGIDPLTGAPIAGATVNALSDDRRPGSYDNILRLTAVGTTDPEGFMAFAPDRISGNSRRSGDYLLTYGDDRYGVPVWMNPRTAEEPTADNVGGSIFTSLAIVHPGDTVGVAAVAYTYGKAGRRVLADTPMKIELRDVNGNPVDTLRATTDAFGRIHGRFDIPTGQLTGNYRLLLSRDGDKLSGRERGVIATATLMVSDYKLPTFKVEIDRVLQGTPAEGEVTLRGRVVTYSGFGLGDATAEMRLTVNRSFWWWRGGGEQEVTTLPVTLNADGTFNIVIDRATFSRSPYREGSYTAEVTATSPSGETQSARQRFAIGEAYAIRARIPSAIEASEPVRLDVSVVNAEDSVVEATLRYALIKNNGKTDSDTIARGTFSTANPVVDFSQVTPGTYSILLTPGGDIAGNCESESTGRVAIYRRGVNISPSPDMLWMTRRDFTAAPGEKVEITFGMPERATDPEGGNDESLYHVLYLLSANDSLIERRWIDARPGFNTLTVEMPQALSARVMLCSTSDYVNARADVTLTSPAMRRSLRVERESFRDHLVPGAPERWTLRISDVTPGADSAAMSQAPVTRAAVMARMYNRALDALTASSLWQLFPASYSPTSPMWRSPALGSTSYPSVYGKVTFLRTSSPLQPEFDTYGRPLFRGQSRNRFFGYSRGAKSAMVSNAVVTEDAIEEAEDEMAVEETAVMAMGVKAEYKMAAAPAVAGDAGMSVAETEDAIEEENGSTRAPNDSSDSFDYRDGEVPLAFFRPTLASDPDGTVTVSFTTPNANASWCFGLMAWTEEMITGSMAADVVSSKPIMVQPNLPRFLRTGDRAVLRALVMNHSAEPCDVRTVVEIFDPATSRLIGKPVTHDAALGANASATALIEVEVPAGINMIGYRVRSTSAGFTDGEQTVIPVLPSSQPVVESLPFYLAPAEEDFELKLPDFDKRAKDAKVTLQYCNDPAWYVITALPGLAPERPSTATDASLALMSAAVARGIVEKYPAVADALRQWQQSDRSDSTLVSMLERNQDLRTVLLQETPWMAQAASDTERMARLLLLTDRKRCDEAIRSCIDLLDKLTTPEGAWGWSPSFNQPSLWVTYSVLGRIGRLRELGFMPDDKRLAAMVGRAVTYCDSEGVKAWRLNPDGEFTLYASMRDLFPEVAQSSEARRVSDRAVQTVITRWRDYDISSKASAALLLNSHGYASTAREVVASIMDYAVTTPQGAMWWPSAAGGAMAQLGCAARVLDALTVIAPQSADIDRIRQWLVLQKEARDWGTGTVATDVIASFLASTPAGTSSWLTSDADTRITLGRRQVKFTPADKTLGYMRTDISSLHPSGATLRIRRPSAGHGPAWGSVIRQFEASMDSIAAESCPAVSITKRLTPLTSGSPSDGWNDASSSISGEASPTNSGKVGNDASISVGDRVRVQLIIRVNEPMDYVVITDERAACLEPVDQLPGYIYSEGLGFYRENRDASTRIFIDRLPRGVYILTYDMYVAQAGTFASGVATLQSQYAPALTAHSASTPLTTH